MSVSFALRLINLENAYLHQCGVTKAASSVGKRVSDAEIGTLASFLVIDTKEHKALVGHRINEVLALDDDWV